MILIGLILPTPAARASGSIAINGQLLPYTVRLRALTGLLDITLIDTTHQQLDLVNGLAGWRFACPRCWQAVDSVVFTTKAAPLALVCALCAGQLPN